jgi:hypothetical protein
VRKVPIIQPSHGRCNLIKRCGRAPFFRRGAVCARALRCAVPERSPISGAPHNRHKRTLYARGDKPLTCATLAGRTGVEVGIARRRGQIPGPVSSGWMTGFEPVLGVSPIVNLVPAARNPKFRPSRPQRRAWIETRVRLVTNERGLFLPASVLVADGNDSIRPRLDRKRRLSRPQCRERIETRAGGHSGFHGTAGPRREVRYPQALILRSI